MLDVATTVAWLIAGWGFLMVVGALMFRAMKRLLRLSDETVADPWFRRNDTSGLSLAINWLRPGLYLMIVGGAAALLLEAV